MKNITIFPGSVLVSVGLLIFAALLAMGASKDCMKDLDLEKELGVKFDKVVEGSDPASPAEEVTSRALIGSLTVVNGASKRMRVWVSNNSTFSDNDIKIYMLPPALYTALAVVDPSGNTYLKACPTPGEGSGTCYYKTLNDTLRYAYLWVIH